MRATYEQGHLVVEVRDDGRGIDWDGLAERARARGLKVPPERVSTELLLAEGVSTRDQVTELSGRGVGFGAAAEAARRLGGELEVHSAAGQGTTVRFVFPASDLRGPVAPAVVSVDGGRTPFAGGGDTTPEPGPMGEEGEARRGRALAVDGSAYLPQAGG